MWRRKKKEAGRDSNWVGDMNTQLAANKAKAEAEFVPPELSETWKLVVLMRQWFLVYKEPTSQRDVSLLESILKPTSLTERERKLWYWSGLQEARYNYLRTLNTSWSKSELHQRLRAVGLEIALQGFDEETQVQLTDGVIKYLPEGGSYASQEEAGKAKTDEAKAGR